VYKAVWNSMTVAAKVITVDASSMTRHQVERLRLETQLALTLRHPNIVQTYTTMVLPAESTMLQTYQSSAASSPDVRLCLPDTPTPSVSLRLVQCVESTGKIEHTDTTLTQRGVAQDLIQ
jgi:hypothetical protein